MPWQCRLIGEEQLQDASYKVQIGDMWFVRDLANPERQESPLHFLSARYYRDWYGKRDPICVMLPCGHFYVDTAVMQDGKPHPQKEGWAVTGTPPLLTLSPSINVVGAYHGWLQNGVISDDCEGRTFT